MNKTDSLEFEQIAREIFAPIYPVIAKQIIAKTGVSRGQCLDIGTGPGCLGLALAEISNLEVCLLDISEKMIDYAKKNIQLKNMGTQVQALCADVHDLPFPDQSIDLIISRGSVFFWDNLQKAFQEIYRVLAPGGRTFIGGGFGTVELKQEISRKMTQKDPEWDAKTKKRLNTFSASDYDKILDDLNVPFEIINDNTGLWILIRREL